MLLQQKPQTINVITNQNATNITSISNQIEVITTTIQTWISEKKDDGIDLLRAFINYTKNHKFFIGGCVCSGLYTYLLFYTLKMKHFLYNKICWHNWRQELSFEELCLLPAADVSQALLHQIQSQYMNHQNPTDNITPLVKFINTIENEIKKLGRYITIGNLLTRLKISMILPINQSSISTAQQKLQRLHFIKHIFTESIASQNVSVVT